MVTIAFVAVMATWCALHSAERGNEKNANKNPLNRPDPSCAILSSAPAFDRLNQRELRLASQLNSLSTLAKVARPQ